MSYHIVNIDAPLCTLSCPDGQLICKSDAGEKKLPLEDVAAIIITSFSATIHSSLLIQAAKQGVALILCEAFKPVSLVIPANRSTDTILTRAQIRLAPACKAQLWQKTVDAKCQNQFYLVQHLAPRNPGLQRLQSCAFGRQPHKEALCAKLFWMLFAQELPFQDFVRGRFEGGLNKLLNYGYAVLLSTILQKLFGVGIDPTFGISHVMRERGTPLAYDLMEPFRPLVDWRVFQWAQQQPAASTWEVTKEFRQWVTGFPLEKIEYGGHKLEVRGCIEAVARSFRRALLDGRAALYKPWTPRNSRWAG